MSTIDELSQRLDKLEDILMNVCQHLHSLGSAPPSGRRSATATDDGSDTIHVSTGLNQMGPGGVVVLSPDPRIAERQRAEAEAGLLAQRKAHALQEPENWGGYRAGQ